MSDRNHDFDATVEAEGKRKPRGYLDDGYTLRPLQPCKGMRLNPDPDSREYVSCSMTTSSISGFCARCADQAPKESEEV